MRKSPGWSVFLLPAIAACSAFATGDARAQAYPAKPIRMLVGYVPGGAVDFTARLVGQKLSEKLGQPVVIENRPGAATAIATERAAKSPADGYTLLLIATSTAVQSALRTNLPYDLKRDLAAISLVSIGPFVLVVHPSLPARNVKDFVALARAQPGKLDYGSPGIGSANHLAGELFIMHTKIRLVHVPFKGSGEAVVATASGMVPVSFSSIAGALSLLESGRLRALAVTSAKRVSLLPALPTMDESGLPGYDYFAWYGVSTAAGVPKEIISRLNAALAAVAPEMRDALYKQGFEPRSSTPEQFASMIHREIEQTAKLIALTGLKAE